MHASRRSRSCETRIKPFFFFKYSRTHALASWSRWFVGSSIRSCLLYTSLEQNDNLYDWISYYDTHKEAITKEDSYPSLPSATGYDYVENYYFRCGEGNPNYATSELNIPVERAESFEEGYARFLSRWKLRTVNQDTYYQGLAKGYFNGAGLTTCEVYLIKAECLARQVTGNDFSAAMDVLNKVRKTRILPEIYQPLQASTLTEAIDLIRCV